VGVLVKDIVDVVDELISNKDKEREELSFDNLPIRDEPRI